MRKSDISRLIKLNNAHKEKQAQIRRDGEIMQKKREAIEEDIMAANNAHMERIWEELNSLQRRVNERESVARARLNELRQGDDEARQRYATEISGELEGVEEPAMIMNYYEQVKQEGGLKYEEAARAIKNKLWKAGNEAVLHNFKEKLVEDMPDNEKQIRFDISEARALKKELDVLGPWVEQYTEEAMNGETSEEMERALLTDFADPVKMEREARAGLADTI